MSKAFAVIGAGYALLSSVALAEPPYEGLVNQTIKHTVGWYVDNTYDNSVRTKIIKTCNTSKPIYVMSPPYAFAAFSVFGCDNGKVVNNFVLTLRHAINEWQVLSNDEIQEDELNELAVVGDTLFITYLTEGPNDAFCCPSVKITHRYQITSRGIQFLN